MIADGYRLRDDEWEKKPISFRHNFPFGEKQENLKREIVRIQEDRKGSWRKQVRARLFHQAR